MVYDESIKNESGANRMTIKEVCEQCGVSADTLRYYEKVGVIPTVSRTRGGIRNYDEESVRWVKSALFLRQAGVPITQLVEYVRLFQEGDSTFGARKELLESVRVDVLAKLDECREMLRRLDYKIERYDEALRTGVLTWDKSRIEQET